MSQTRWNLEVVRGRTVGRIYPLSGEQVTLGNKLNGTPGIDLAGEEAEGPRRMAGCQALLECKNGQVALRDLDSPGGTFVNRQRVLPGQSRPLRDGDVLQLGGVQLKLVVQSPTDTTSPPPQPSAPSSPSSGFPCVLAGGTTCRSWDQILTTSAQKWHALRDDLSAGRLDALARSMGRPDLAPPATGTLDERLDAWLQRLPTTKPSLPVLEVVQPRSLVVKVSTGGGRTRRVVSLANVGYRLLKVTARVEPVVDWVKLTGGTAQGSLAIVESAELGLEINIPDTMTGSLSTSLVLDSNGGTQTVPIRLELAQATAPTPEAPAVGSSAGLTLDLPLSRRLAIFPLACVAIRLLMGLAARVVPGQSLAAEPTAAPGLFGPLVLFALVGVVIGVLVALRAPKQSGSVGRLITSLLSFGLLGGFASTLLVAVARSIELGSIGQNPVVTAILWAVLGIALACASLWAVPQPESRREQS